MNQHSPLSASGSLLERAAELYGFGVPAARPLPVRAPEPVPVPEPEPALKQPEPLPEISRVQPQPKPKAAPARFGRTGTVDRARLKEAALFEPDAPVGPLAEEFRIVKRQLLLTANAATELPPEKRRVILLCSAQPDEGKTFCALNLALSLAGEKDVEVLLVDADFPKPEILS